MGIESGYDSPSGSPGFYGNSTMFNPGQGYFGNYQSSAGAGAIGANGSHYSIQGGPAYGALHQRGTFLPGGSAQYGGGMAPGLYGTGGASPRANNLRGMMRSGELSPDYGAVMDQMKKNQAQAAGYNPVANNQAYQAQQQAGMMQSQQAGPRQAALMPYGGR